LLFSSPQFAGYFPQIRYSIPIEIPIEPSPRWAFSFQGGYIMSNQRCCHVKLNGARCTMATLHGKDLCFTHDMRLMRARTKPCPPPTTHWTTAPLFDLRYPETFEDIIANGHSALDAFARHQIDFRQLSAATRHMAMIQKSMLSAERHNKKLEQLTAENIVRHVRYDADGNARVVDEPTPGSAPATTIPEPAAEPPLATEPEPQPSPESDSDSDPEIAAAKEFFRKLTTIPAINACCEPEPSAEVDQSTEPSNLSAEQPDPELPDIDQQAVYFHTSVKKTKLKSLFPTLAKSRKYKAFVFKHMRIRKIASAPPPPRDRRPAISLKFANGHSERSSAARAHSRRPCPENSRVAPVSRPAVVRASPPAPISASSSNDFHHSRVL
jgi:hypothetical protein